MIESLLFLKNILVPVNSNTLRKLVITSFAVIPAIHRFFFLGKKYKIRFIFFLTRTKLLNMTVKRMNHSKYLCSTRHLMLHLNFSQLKCCLENTGNIQHSGKQSSTSTMYFGGIPLGDWVTVDTISPRPKRST